MIRINLARKKTAVSGGSTEEQFELYDTASSAKKQAFVKIFLMFLFVGILMFYENHNVTHYQGELLAQSSKIAELEADLESKKRETSGMVEIERNAQVLEQKLTIMKKLSRGRLREVKALDYIQGVLPEKVWFKDIKFEESSLILQGFAVSDEDLNELTRSLENSVQFSNVIILQAKEAKIQNSTYKQFEISCNTEVAN